MESDFSLFGDGVFCTIFGDFCIIFGDFCFILCEMCSVLFVFGSNWNSCGDVFILLEWDKIGFVPLYTLFLLFFVFFMVIFYGLWVKG
jgi:hypothetical protein